MKIKKTKEIQLLKNIRSIIETSRHNIVREINETIIKTYYEIGRLLIENEQKGKIRAEYSEQTINYIALQLAKEFGRGFSATNLRSMRSFYLSYKESQIWQTLSAKLSWSHYLVLLRIENPDERKFYEVESDKENWSVRELKRQLDSSLFERLALSRSKTKVKQLSKRGQIISKPQDAIKDPTVLEFLGFEEKDYFSESDLESALIDKLGSFLLELGKGFTFEARQKRISFDEKHFYIDLVFYHRILKCFVLIDLKIGELKHQDIGQMQMYVNFYDREIKTAADNKTIGLILCKDKDDMIVNYTLPKNNKQIYASKYQLYLPSKKELKKQLLSNNET
jgi:predicted nuclease of restriction endonuclease-like (RecB) superfamily